MALEKLKIVRGVPCKYWKIKDLEIRKPAARIEYHLFYSSAEADDFENSQYHETVHYSSGFSVADMAADGVDPLHLAYLKLRQHPTFTEIVNGGEEVQCAIVEGRTADNCDTFAGDLRLWGRHFKTGDEYTVELYRNEDRTTLIASGSIGTAYGTVELIPFNGSGVTGRVTLSWAESRADWYISMSKDV